VVSCSILLRGTCCIMMAEKEAKVAALQRRQNGSTLVSHTTNDLSTYNMVIVTVLKLLAPKEPWKTRRFSLNICWKVAKSSRMYNVTTYVDSIASSNYCISTAYVNSPITVLNNY
jgi:hypothetical protein